MNGKDAEACLGAGTVKQYVVQDQLGSTRLVTDAVGGVVRRSDYLPYGEEVPGAVGGRTLTGYGADGGERQGFTGQARDVETGLDYFGARYYSGALGRFSSLDVPLFDQSPSDPMSWNLFAYVRNNPLRYIDPTGRGCVSTQGAHSSTGIPLWTNTSDPRVPGPSCEEIDKADRTASPSVTVVGQAGSLAEYLFADRGARYVPNDVPLSNSSRQVLSSVHKKTWPVAEPVCSTGVFAFRGRGVHAGSGSAGAAIEGYGVVDFNSSDGISVGLIAETAVSIGPLTIAGAKERAVNVKSGKVHDARLGFVTVGRFTGMVDFDSPAFGLLAGDKSGVGVYAVPSFVKGCGAH